MDGRLLAQELPVGPAPRRALEDHPYNSGVKEGWLLRGGFSLVVLSILLFGLLAILILLVWPKGHSGSALVMIDWVAWSAIGCLLGGATMMIVHNLIPRRL